MTSLRAGAAAFLASTTLLAGAAAPPAHAQSHQLRTLVSSGSSVSHSSGAAVELSSGPVLELSSGSSLARSAGSTAHLSSDPDLDPVFNDEHCVPDVPSPAPPNPVVFLHGTGTGAHQFTDTAVNLREQGFCPWAVNYGAGHLNLPNAVPGQHGYAAIEDSLDEVAAFIDDVLTVTGAGQVDLVGHSQGGTLIKAYIQAQGGADRVGRAVSLGATFRGTTLGELGALARSAADVMPGSSEFTAGAAAIQQLADSEFIAELDRLPDTTPGIIYTALYSPSDLVATPVTTSMLESVDGADVVNVDVEATCGITVSHGDLARSPEVAGLIHWGLTRAEGDHAVGPGQCGERGHES